jgi:hypothetical protein
MGSFDSDPQRKYKLMTSNSRMQLNPETGLPDIRDFAEFSVALRGMASDEETVRLTEGMGELSAAVEVVGKALSSHQRGSTVGPLLVDLLTALRKHRQLVVALSESWRTLYEYGNYLAALNNLRVLVSQWLMERNISGDKEVMIEDFEMIGWRTLGEGILMIDMHEQARVQVKSETGMGELPESQIMRAKQWWGNIRG